MSWQSNYVVISKYEIEKRKIESAKGGDESDPNAKIYKTRYIYRTISYSNSINQIQDIDGSNDNGLDANDGLVEHIA